MKAFVTGATGLLGNNLVRCLEEAGHEVVALVRNAEKAQRVLSGTSVRLVVGDMQRVEDFADELASCDAVFHTAAYFRETFEPGSDEAVLDAINIGATMRLLDAADAATVPCFVHVSSAGVVGQNADGSPADENTPPLPMQAQNPYFRSKIRGDAALEAWRGKSDIAIVEVLPGWIWGPWDAAPTAAGKLIGEFVDRKIPANIGGGTSIVDARDVAAAMIAGAARAVERRRDGVVGNFPRIEKYLVGGHFCSMKQIMDHLEAATGVAGPRFEIPYVVLLAYGYGCEFWGTLTGGAPLLTSLAVRVLAMRIRLDSSKMHRELGVEFRPVEETFRESVEWWASDPGSPKR